MNVVVSNTNYIIFNQWLSVLFAMKKSCIPSSTGYPGWAPAAWQKTAWDWRAPGRWLTVHPRCWSQSYAGCGGCAACGGRGCGGDARSRAGCGWVYSPGIPGCAAWQGGAGPTPYTGPRWADGEPTHTGDNHPHPGAESVVAGRWTF